MKPIAAYFQRHRRTLYAILLFALSAGILVYIFPKGGKFEYEYEKGRPWMHQNLIAPYDFPVYKTDEELRKERDSVLKNMPSYYQYKTEVKEKKLASFTNNFDKIWERKREEQDSVLKNNRFVKELSINKNNKWYKRTYYKKITELLKVVYNRGILEFMPYGEEYTSTNQIQVVKDNHLQKYNLEQIFTLKSAYKYIFNQLKESAIYDNPRIAQDEIDFIKELNINRYLEPNLFFDAQTTQKARQNALEKISLTSGVVQKGERIIFRGEVVTQEKLKILNSLKRQYESSVVNSGNRHLIILGHVIFIAFILFTLFLFMKAFRDDVIEDTIKTLFILLMIILFIGISIFTLKFENLSLYLLPYAILPMIIRIFYDTRLALYVHFVTILLIGFLAPNGFEFILLQFSAGIISIISLKTLTRRSQLFITAGYVFLTYSLIYFSLSILHEGTLGSIKWMNFIFFAINGMLLLFTYPFIYMLEKGFGFLSDVTLIELSDSNNTLLRSLAERSPGTFQHSMQVGNLAETAIQKIGGNPLLVRTGALYHDIGKMEIPQYFIENQRMDMNPHDELEFDKSAEIIISHVTRGVKMAQKHRLPKQIIDFIKTHHGTNKVLYFYRSYINKYPDENVDISKFTYPGPKPFSKEMAVLMMADSVEAASRSLKAINENAIDDLVESIINGQIDNKQFTNADITFKDITTIKKLFKQKMGNIYHSRIEYPKQKKPTKAGE